MAVGEPHPSRGCAGLVDHFDRLDRETKNFRRRPWGDLDDFPRVAPGDASRSRKEYLERGVQTLAGSGRTGDHKRAGTAAEEMAIHQQEHHSTEMIAVQVTQHDAVDGAGIDVSGLQRGQRAGAAVEEKVAACRLDAEAGVEPAAGTEGVARADDRQLHALALGRAATCACHRLTYGQSKLAAMANWQSER